jgi:hypothetical protein
MGPNHSFLGFVKNTPKDSLKGCAYSTNICYPPQACVKIKKYSLEMVGEIGKWNLYKIYINLWQLVTLEHDTLSLLVSRFGNPFVSC